MGLEISAVCQGEVRTWERIGASWAKEVDEIVASIEEMAEVQYDLTDPNMTMEQFQDSVYAEYQKAKKRGDNLPEIIVEPVFPEISSACKDDLKVYEDFVYLYADQFRQLSEFREYLLQNLDWMEM